MSKRTIASLLMLLVGVFGLLSIPPSPAGLGLQPFQGSTTSTACTVSAESRLTVHVADANGRPVPSATVLLNGTFVCNGVVYPSNFSGTKTRMETWRLVLSRMRSITSP